MAGLLNETVNQLGDNGNTNLNRIIHNPMFGDLQATLMNDMNTESVPYSLQNFDHPAASLNLYSQSNVSFNDASYGNDDSPNKGYSNEHGLAVVSNEEKPSNDSGYIELNNNDYSKYDYNPVYTTSDIGEATVATEVDQNRCASPTEMEATDHLNGLTAHDSQACSPVHSQACSPVPNEDIPTQMIDVPISIPSHQLQQTPIEVSPTKEDNLHESALISAIQPSDEIVSNTPQTTQLHHCELAPQNISNSPETYNAIPMGEESRTYNYSPSPTTSSEPYHVGQSIQEPKPYIIPGGYPIINATPVVFQNTDTPTKAVKEEGFDLLVEEATLQAEFRQMGPLGNDKVTELENFYNTKNAEIMTQHSDALTSVHIRELTPEQLDSEVNQLNFYYNKQREHLVVRISQSLQLFKNSLPTEPPPPVPSGGAKKPSKSRLLNSKAVSIMNNWYQEHIDYPYPSDEQKQQLAEEGGISLAQVKAWFANKRNRSLNTKPKRQKAKLAHELSHICQKLAQAKEIGGDLSGAKSYNMILQELSTMTNVKAPTVPRNSYTNTLSVLQQQYVGNYQPVHVPNVAPPGSPFPFYMNMQMHH